MAVLVITTFVAALVTGMTGYGFSSITIPICIQFFGRALLNPAIVLVEVGTNTYTVFANRKSLSKVWRKALAIFSGLAPGAMIGALLLPLVEEGTARAGTLLLLAALVLLRSAGYKKPIHLQGKTGFIFGGILGIIYSMTTISGPPLSVALTNDGYSREELKALVGLIRLVESAFAAATYFYLGYINSGSLNLLAWVLPGVLIGLPLGSALAEKVPQDIFRRLCVLGDAWLIGFGLINSIALPIGWIIACSIVLFDAYKMRAFLMFRKISKATQKTNFDSPNIPKSA